MTFGSSVSQSIRQSIGWIVNPSVRLTVYPSDRPAGRPSGRPSGRLYVRLIPGGRRSRGIDDPISFLSYFFLISPPIRFPNGIEEKC